MNMKIAEIQNLISGTPFHFETFRDFRGVYDRKKENHNVITNGYYRIVARNTARTKWQVTTFTQDGQLVLMSKVLSLKDCLIFCNLRELDKGV